MREEWGRMWLGCVGAHWFLHTVSNARIGLRVISQRARILYAWESQE